jgi:hypothetical protein
MLDVKRILEQLGVVLLLLPGLCTSATTRADTVAPGVMVLADVPGDTNLYLMLRDGGTLFTCAGRVTKFLASVGHDGDGLGAPFFGSNLTYAWSFGGGVPQNPLDVFSGVPQVTFNAPATVTLQVFDAVGNSRAFRVSIHTVGC